MIKFIPSIVFLILMSSSLNAENLLLNFDNQETFPITISNNQGQLIIQAKTQKTFSINLLDTNIKISSENGSSIEYDLNNSCTNDNDYILVTLKNESLEISNQNQIFINIKPFRAQKVNLLYL